MVWLPFFIFPLILGNKIIPIDFHIFQRGGPTTNQIIMIIIMIIIIMIVIIMIVIIIMIMIIMIMIIIVITIMIMTGGSPFFRIPPDSILVGGLVAIFETVPLILGNNIIPTDELHHFSEGWPWPTNQVMIGYLWQESSNTND